MRLGEEEKKMKTYTFHVSLPGTGRVWRKIEMRADQTLEDLHFAIQKAYGWDADHLYSFFMSGKAWDKSTEYCLPEGYTPYGEPMYDEEEEFMYLFDYGDAWRFKVRVHAVHPDAPEGDYPRIVESVGEAPEQYPSWDWE